MPAAVAADLVIADWDERVSFARKVLAVAQVTPLVIKDGRSGDGGLQWYEDVQHALTGGPLPADLELEERATEHGPIRYAKYRALARILIGNTVTCIILYHY